MPTKEIKAYETTVTKASEFVSSLKITNDDDYKKANDTVLRLNQVAKEVKEKKESITKPLNEGLKQVRAMFAPIEASLEEAMDAVKVKVLDYRKKLAAIAEAKTEKIAEKVEAGKMSFEKGAEKIDALDKPKSSINAEAGQVQFRKVKKAIIEDASKIPDEYWIVDEVAVRKAALAGVEIPGVKVVEEEVMAKSSI